MLATCLLFAIGALQQDSPADHVMVVINQPSMESVEIGSYYRAMRKIPRENVVFVDVSRTEEVTESEYKSAIEDKVRDAIKKSPHQIDYIVLTKGIPIRIAVKTYSVDALLAAMDVPFTPMNNRPDEADIRSRINPYYKKDEPFSSKKYGFYLVTRLDGYDVNDAKALVDHSLAAKASKGPFFFDEAGNRNGSGYGDMQKTLAEADQVLAKKGFDATLETTAAFVAPPQPVMGYASWGSNDSAFSLDTYKKIHFLPGALCETFVSTSGRTFNHTTGGQSLIADLIANGVTGIKGYVSEPYTFALADPSILFDRYTSGRNLAESFYSASLVLKWKDLVIGDPLCSPYAK